jgi:hypothetical protein
MPIKKENVSNKTNPSDFHINFQMKIIYPQQQQKTVGERKE